MQNVNLTDAQKGAFPEEKDIRVECWILHGLYYMPQGRVKVSFYKNGTSDSTRTWWVTGSRTLALLASKELTLGDLVEVQFSESGKEVAELVKFGHLYFEDELKEMGLWESPEGKGRS